ncbi:MAG: class I SAM-dependent methyltransferase [Planctomycetota bacterium]|jgi:SAM-dependent methyltransferase
MKHRGDVEYWENRYQAGDKPWDTGRPSPELVRQIEGLGLTGGRVLEVGCGTASDAIWMAERGFTVVAIDLSPTVLAMAREKAKAAGAEGLTIVEEDFFAESPVQGGGFDFVYDRGAFHHQADGTYRQQFAEQVRHTLRPSGTWLSLCGSTDDEDPGGPPRLRASDIVVAVEPFFVIRQLRALDFRGKEDGRLGWSCLMERRDAVKA